MVGSSAGIPSGAPGRPTLVSPVRIGDWPVMKAARPGGAALLAVPVGEQRTLGGDAVDVGRLVAHHAVVVGADVELADVVAPDDDDVRLLRVLRRSRRWPRIQPRAHQDTFSCEISPCRQIRAANRKPKEDTVLSRIEQSVVRWPKLSLSSRSIGWDGWPARRSSSATRFSHGQTDACISPRDQARLSCWRRCAAASVRCGRGAAAKSTGGRRRTPDADLHRGPGFLDRRVRRPRPGSRGSSRCRAHTDPALLRLPRAEFLRIAGGRSAGLAPLAVLSTRNTALAREA